MAEQPSNHSTMIFHPTVEPPYFVCIFSNQHATSSVDLQGYAELAEEIHQLAQQQSGYLGIDSTRNAANGFGITVSYWASNHAMLAWKQQADHLGAQRLGRDRFYADYHVHIAKVEREYSMITSTQHEQLADDSRKGTEE